jgi:hypothetical protein
MPTASASPISAALGSTASGTCPPPAPPAPGANRLAMLITNTPIASAIAKTPNSRNSVRARAPATSFAKSATLRARLRMELYMHPKSCTAPTKIHPSTIHSSAGTQPQMTAIAGPSSGPSPAIDAKWCPNTTSGGAGTKSRPSRRMWAGVGSESSSGNTRVANQRPYQRYANTSSIATPSRINSALITATGRSSPYDAGFVGDGADSCRCASRKWSCPT